MYYITGDVQEVYRSPCCFSAKYAEYVSADGTAGVVLFHRAWKELNVRVEPHAEFDRFGCTKCQGWKVKLETLEKRLLECSHELVFERESIELKILDLKVMQA